jgi:2-dehydro-3-deoxyphosphooctonate aldolase (KDO 8-P synthase)
LVFFGGPCVIESRDHAFLVASRLAEICVRLNRPWVFKASYDKANRTSLGSFRGLGLDEGLRILEAVGREFAVPVITDVHSEQEALAASQAVDVLQIPAFLCRQTSLLAAAGRSGKPVMIKKGQFLHPSDMAYAVEKVKSISCPGVLLCERGTCLGYRDLVVDFRSLEIMRNTGCPVVFDGTHSVQQMGAAGGSSGGARQFVPALCRAAAAVGINGLFLECHDSPHLAPSDGANMIRLDELETLLVKVSLIDALLRESLLS